MEKVYGTFSSKGQLVIPAGIREALGIEAGTRVAIRQEGTRVILEPETLKAKLEMIEKMCGITKDLPSGTDLLLEERRQARERERIEEGW